MGLKQGIIWEHPWGTHWELKERIGNLKETCCEQMEKWKIIFPYWEQNLTQFCNISFKWGLKKRSA